MHTVFEHAKHAHKTVRMNGANRYEHGAMRKQRENANACDSCGSCGATKQLALYSTVPARSNPQLIQFVLFVEF
jgi:hypothetical protein